MAEMNLILESLKDADLSELKFPMVTVYDHPKDLPVPYLARVWEGADCRPTMIAVQCRSLEDLREDIRAAGFEVLIPRSEEDDPVIIETWIR